mmetsp:Transcript_19329/g.40759  ORF Transcript_19329/g.40759 Transcript_19329/m.40759 type:complete len:95 (+) Transcript_19329:409-693(+)
MERNPTNTRGDSQERKQKGDESGLSDPFEIIIEGSNNVQEKENTDMMFARGSVCPHDEMKVVLMPRLREEWIDTMMGKYKQIRMMWVVWCTNSR